MSISLNFGWFLICTLLTGFLTRAAWAYKAQLKKSDCTKTGEYFAAEACFDLLLPILLVMVVYSLAWTWIERSVHDAASFAAVSRVESSLQSWRNLLEPFKLTPMLGLTTISALLIARIAIMSSDTYILAVDKLYALYDRSQKFAKAVVIALTFGTSLTLFDGTASAVSDSVQAHLRNHREAYKRFCESTQDVARDLVAADIITSVSQQHPNPDPTEQLRSAVRAETHAVEKANETLFRVYGVLVERPIAVNPKISSRKDKQIPRQGAQRTYGSRDPRIASKNDSDPPERSTLVSISRAESVVEAERAEVVAKVVDLVRSPAGKKLPSAALKAVFDPKRANEVTFLVDTYPLLGQLMSTGLDVLAKWAGEELSSRAERVAVSLSVADRSSVADAIAEVRSTVRAWMDARCKAAVDDVLSAEEKAASLELKSLYAYKEKIRQASDRLAAAYRVRIPAAESRLKVEWNSLLSRANVLPIPEILRSSGSLANACIKELSRTKSLHARLESLTELSARIARLDELTVGRPTVDELRSEIERVEYFEMKVWEAKQRLNKDSHYEARESERRRAEELEKALKSALAQISPSSKARWPDGVSWMFDPKRKAQEARRRLVSRSHIILLQRGIGEMAEELLNYSPVPNLEPLERATQDLFSTAKANLADDYRHHTPKFSSQSSVAPSGWYEKRLVEAADAIRYQIRIKENPTIRPTSKPVSSDPNWRPDGSRPKARFGRRR